MSRYINISEAYYCDEPILNLTTFEKYAFSCITLLGIYLEKQLGCRIKQISKITL